jgi:ABC-type polysaccharide/polyol phosphate export permease
MFKNFPLVRELAWTDFKLRYSGSKLGFFWSFLKPLIMLFVLYTVFALVIKSPVNNYLLFLFLGIILWNYFVESTVISMNNMLSKRGLVKSVYFPREILVISSNLNAGLTLCFNILIFFLILFIAKIALSWNLLLFFFILALLYLFSLGASYLLSALYVSYRDIIHIWDVLTQVGFWATPIVYASSIIPEKYSAIYFLNPMTRIITYSRDVLLEGKGILLMDLFTTFILCISIYLFGYYLYKYMSRSFAEDI